MKKFLLALAVFASAVLVACGPSKLEMQEMSSSCDVIIEVRQVLNDSINFTRIGGIIHV